MPAAAAAACAKACKDRFMRVVIITQRPGQIKVATVSIINKIINK